MRAAIRTEATVGGADEVGSVGAASGRPTGLMIVTLGLLTAVGPFSLDAYLPALPMMAVDLGVSAPTIQFSLTACLLGLGLGQLVAGPLGDRFGRRVPIIIGIGIYTIASIGCAVAPSATVLIIWRAVQGLAGAAGVVLARASVQDVATDKAATKLYSQMAIISGVAPVIAPVIGAAIFGAFGWRAVFILLATIGLGLLILVLFVLRETHARENRRSAHPLQVLRGFGSLLADGSFRRFTIVSALMAATLFTYISSSPFVIQDVFGMDDLAFALIFAGNGLGLSVAGLVYARIVARVNPAAVLRAASTVQLVGLIVVATSVAVQTWGGVPSAPLLVVGLFITIVPLGFILPTCTAFAMARSGERAGAASALLGVGTFFIGGLVSPLSGFGDPAVLMAAIMVVSGGLGLLAAWSATRDLV